MIETFLSIFVILVFVGVLAGILFFPASSILSKLFAASCTNSCEDTDMAIKRAINGKIIKVNFLGQGNKE